MLAHGGAALALIGISLLAGMIGYAHYEHMSWLTIGDKPRFCFKVVPPGSTRLSSNRAQ